MAARGGRGWPPAPAGLDPLAQLLRRDYPSRTALARVLGYQTPRTYTDGRWTAQHRRPEQVLAALAGAVDFDELDLAVGTALHNHQLLLTLTPGQRVLLEALRGYDDELVIAMAPHPHDLLEHQSGAPPAGGAAPAAPP